MADKPVLTDYETKLCAELLQPLFDMVWDGLGETPVPPDVRTHIGAMPVDPSDGNTYVAQNGGWQILTPLLVNTQWGDIGGTLADQTDLQAALDLKIEDAPADGEVYGRQDNAWIITPAFVDAPLDGVIYGRQSGAWTASPVPIGGTAGQHLVKASDTDYDTEWAAPAPTVARKNLFINQQFRIWQRPEPITVGAALAYTADRWAVRSTATAGGTAQVSKVTDPDGLTALRHAFTGVTSYQFLGQRIEYARTASGRRCSLSLWVKNVTANIYLVPRFVQNFGTGGTPASTVTFASVEGGQQIISGQRAKYTWTVDIPSTEGSQIGTDNNDFLGVYFDIYGDSGGTIPPVNATLDVEAAQFEAGEVPTDLEWRHEGEDWNLCLRFYWQGQALGVGNGYLYSGNTGNIYLGPMQTFPVRMRAQPVMSVITTPTFTRCTESATPFTARVEGFIHRVDVTAVGTYRASGGIYEADAEL